MNHLVLLCSLVEIAMTGI